MQNFDVGLEKLVDFSLKVTRLFPTFKLVALQIDQNLTPDFSTKK